MDLELQIKQAADNVASIKAGLEKYGKEAEEGKKAITQFEEKLSKVATADELKSFQDAMQKQFDELAVKAKKSESKEVKSLGQAISEKVAPGQVANELDAKGKFRLELPEVKSFSLTGDQVASYSNRQAILPAAALNFRDIVPNFQTSTGLYVFYKETATTNNIAKQTTLGATKGENSYDLSEVKVVQRYIAGFTQFPKQMAEDLPFLSGAMPRMLQRDYFSKENDLFFATVSAAATGTTTTTATDDVEQIIQLIANQRTAKFTPSVVLVSEAQMARLLINTYNKGFYAGAGAVQIVGQGLNIWGVPVVSAPWVTDDKALVLDNNYIERVERTGLAIEFSYEAQDSFVTNQVVARIECRTEINLMLPSSAIYADLGNVA